MICGCAVVAFNYIADMSHSVMCTCDVTLLEYIAAMSLKVAICGVDVAFSEHIANVSDKGGGRWS